MTEEIPIRIGTMEDLDPMMELAMMACEENGFVNPNPTKLLEQIYAALVQDHGLIGIIGKPNEKIEGAVLLRISKMWYSDQDILEEKAIFIHPDYRNAKGGRARRLVEFSKEASDYLKIPLIIGVLSNHRTEAKVRLYERQFGKASGAFFLYNAQTGGWKEAAE